MTTVPTGSPTPDDGKIVTVEIGTDEQELAEARAYIGRLHQRISDLEAALALARDQLFTAANPTSGVSPVGRYKITYDEAS